MSTSDKNIVVLISGSGSNLQAIIDASERGDIAARISAVISNRPNVKGLQRARDHGIEAITLDHRQYADREAFESALADILDGYDPQAIVLAGFMRILTAPFVQKYEGRMLNIHPSLLPLYPGLNTHRRALEAGDTTHGATVHFVTAELDGGPAIVHAEIPVLDGDTETSLAQRVLTREHEIYPLAVRWLVEERIQLREGQCWLDGQPLPGGGVQWQPQ